MSTTVALDPVEPRHGALEVSVGRARVSTGKPDRSVMYFIAVKVFGKYALVVASSLLVGAAIFVSSFVVIDFVWTHFVVTDPQKLSIGDGVVVVGGGFVFGLVFGLAGLVLVLYRSWPRRTEK